MKVDFERSVKRAWKFAVEPRRFLLYAIIFSLLIISILFPFLLIPKGLVLFSVTFLILIIIFALAAVFVQATFIHNFKDQRSFNKSASYVKSRFLTLLAVVIFIGFSTMVVSFIPFLGIILSIIIGLIFYFAYQEVIINKSNFSKTLYNSWGLFKKNWITILITLILTAVLSLIIIFVSLIPLGIILFSALASYLTAKVPILTLVYSNIFAILIGSIILLIGISISALLSIGIQTDVYLQIKRKK